jgi:hypothetical protein
MSRLLHAFTEHPESVGETYLEHMAAALSFALPLFLASAAALVHGVFPFLCVKTSSRHVTRLYERMVVNRVRAASSEAKR